jgi:hypothetical protein
MADHYPQAIGLSTFQKARGSPDITGEPLAFLGAVSSTARNGSIGSTGYLPLKPKLNADPASAADIPKKNPLGAGAR